MYVTVWKFNFVLMYLDLVICHIFLSYRSSCIFSSICLEIFWNLFVSSNGGVVSLAALCICILNSSIAFSSFLLVLSGILQDRLLFRYSLYFSHVSFFLLYRCGVSCDVCICLFKEMITGE